MSRLIKDIPSDWKAIRFDKVFDFLPTLTLSRNDLTSDESFEGIYNIHYGDIHSTYRFVKLDFDKEKLIPKITKEGIDETRLTLLNSGDIVIADASEDYEGVAACIELSNVRDRKVTAGLHTFAARDKKGITSDGFRSYLLKHPWVSNELKKMATGSKVYGVSKTNIAKLEVVLPPLHEQQKIAAILSKWDELIETQTQLITTKEKQKTSLMQKLLTGEVRFPGFEDEWKILPIGKLTKIYDGTHSTPTYTKFGIPFYSVESLTQDDFTNTKFISEEVFEKENKRVKLERGDILMTRIGDIGTAKMLSWDVKASFYVSLALIKKSEKFNSKYLEQYIGSNLFQSELHKRTIHVAFPKKINLGEISDCLVKLPSIKEQEKIAEVLNSCDEEIKSLMSDKN